MGELNAGTIVRLKKPHPWAGHTGEIIAIRETFLGRRPVVRLHDAGGHECFLMALGDADVLSKATQSEGDGK